MRHRGFSLLEVILAVMVFAIVFTGIAATWAFHERSMRQYRDTNTARVLAKTEMERALAFGFAAVDNAARTQVVKIRRTVDGRQSTKDFTVTTEVSESIPDSLKEITVTVEFQSPTSPGKLVLRSRVYRTH
jgi:prepilin-type N-terminal cleavage/methylation domain-containing protein